MSRIVERSTSGSQQHLVLHEEIRGVLLPTPSNIVDGRKSADSVGHKKYPLMCHRLADKAKGSHPPNRLKQEPVEKHLSKLYTPSVEAKIWGIAAKGLQQASPPTLYPEYTKPGGTHYIYRRADFWTSGFFPGSLHLLLERRKKYSHVLGRANDVWADNLHLLSLE